MKKKKIIVTFEAEVNACENEDLCSLDEFIAEGLDWWELNSSLFDQMKLLGIKDKTEWEEV